MMEIVRGLEGNGFAYPGITWEALDCWARRTLQDPTPREAITLITLGRMRANILSESRKTDGQH